MVLLSTTIFGGVAVDIHSREDAASSQQLKGHFRLQWSAALKTKPQQIAAQRTMRSGDVT